MKKIQLLIATVLGIFAVVSCEQEIGGPETAFDTTVINASIESTKTALGEKDGTAWPNYWKAGDQISINGVASEALDAEADGKSSASFSFSGAVATPYYAAYPAAAVSDYSNGSATITVPASQSYVAGSYDPAAFVMFGKSETESSVALAPFVSVFHLSLTGSASITSVKLTGGDGAALSGSFSTDFETAEPKTVSNVVELVADAPVALPAEFFICVPAGLSGPVVVDIYDADSGSKSVNATIKSPLVGGVVYSPAPLAYSAGDGPSISVEGITSSTAIICVDGAAADAYTFNVYSDEACSVLVNSYAVDAGNACWGEAAPRFCISGLEPSTTYYVKVLDVTGNAESAALPVTTKAFTIVEVSSAPAGVGDVILAEDFGELRWDSELINSGVGYFPTSQDSFANSEVDTFLPIDTNSEKTLGSQTAALAFSRLAHWAQGANNNLYIHPGYIKIVGSKKVTHIVTPALDNIPEGKIATLEVELTASAYYSGSSAAFCTKDAIVAVQAPGEFNELTSEKKTNTLDLSSKTAAVTLTEETAWNTYKVTLSGVVKGSRIAFGAAKDVSGNDARMNLSDIKVTIKELDDPGIFTSVKSVSSSTAAFSWTYDGSAEEDIAKPYTIALYSDSACKNLVVSFDIEAEASCWDGKSPCFVFGGLNPSTEYWFRVQDTESGTISKPLSATTEAFTPVDVTTVNSVSAGDVILAEDFSEIGAGPDEFSGAASFVPSSKVLPVVPSVGRTRQRCVGLFALL